MPRRSIMFAAGDAMREQRDRAHVAFRAVEQSGKLMTLGIAEVESLGGHRASWALVDWVALCRLPTVTFDQRRSYRPNSRIAASRPSSVSGYIRPPRSCRII